MNTHESRVTNHDSRPSTPTCPHHPAAPMKLVSAATPVFGTFSSTAILTRTRKRAAPDHAPERALCPCGGQLDPARGVIYCDYLCSKCRNARNEYTKALRARYGTSRSRRALTARRTRRGAPPPIDDFGDDPPSLMAGELGAIEELSL